MELIQPIPKPGVYCVISLRILSHALIWTEGIDIDRYPYTKNIYTPIRMILQRIDNIKSRTAKLSGKLAIPEMPTWAF